jgi:hypothetical protein
LNSAPAPVRFPTRLYAVTDFDGDRLPDRAELASPGFQKNIHLTRSFPRATNLRFFTETLQSGSIHAADIDQDRDNDLIWVSDQHPTQSELWLNNGIGDFTRVADTSAYTAEIKSLVADDSRSGLLASSFNEQLLATGTSGHSLIARNGGCLSSDLRPLTLPRFSHNCLVELSPCITRYPKRGPPVEFS